VVTGRTGGERKENIKIYLTQVNYGGTDSGMRNVSSGENWY
jgi:hypothetical protein